REWIVLMGMTLCAAERRSQPHRRRRIHTVDQYLKIALVFIDPALFVEQSIAMKAAGDLLAFRRIRKHVPGDLLKGELVERHIAVEGINHPVAELPHRSSMVALV